MKENHCEFIVIIYGGRNAYYIPYSWLRKNILPMARIRRRPAEPTQQYLTVDELHNEMFSFGLDRQGNELRFDLSEFRNTINSSSDLYSLINKLKEDAKNQFPEFSSKDSPFIISRHEIEEHYDGNWTEIQNGRFPKLLQDFNRRKFRINVSNNEIIISRGNKNVKDVVETYTRLLQAGAINTTHVKKLSEWRPYQQGLREACLQIYDYHCAMCDVDIRSALIASHIKPASSDIPNRAKLSNVMLLCSLHDSLFDSKLISVRPNYTIACSPKLATRSILLRQWVFEIQGKDITAPQNFAPDPDFLAWHCRKSGISI
jgi:predicted restriction endonuclease